MKVIEIGRLAEIHGDSLLPEHGIVIKASEYELKNVALNILYNDVRIEPIREGGRA